MKLLSLFSGIGAFEKALTKMGVDFELVNYCEIDRYASKSFAAVHGVSEDKNLGDITKVDTGKLPNDIDLLTYGFPCQDISLAGKQKGFENEDGSSTRSGLFFEALRIIEAKQPKVAIAENVKNLVSKKFANEFAIVLESLENAGYNNYWKVLNAKNYGIPQNRERVFVVSIRKDIDDGSFMFPEEIELKIRLKDLLEENVDEKYYLSNSMVESITNWKAHQKPLEKALGQNSICQTLTARGAGENHSGKVIYSDELEETTNVQDRLLVNNANKKGYAEAYEGDAVNLERPTSTTRRGRVGSQVAQTLDTSCNQGVVVKERIEQLSLFDEKLSDKSLQKASDNIRDVNGCSSTITANPQRATIDNGNLIVEKGTSYMRDFGSRGKLQDGEEVCDTLVAAMGTGGGNVPIIIDSTQKHAAISTDGITPTLTSAMGVGGGHVPMHNYGLRIRKLTPKECWRLMGFEDNDIDKAIAVGMSNTQLYKQAGNSIVVNVLEHLLHSIIPIIEEAEEMKKVEEKRIVTFETDKWIDIAALIEREPELFEELARDYPVEDATYIYEVKKGA